MRSLLSVPSMRQARIASRALRGQRDLVAQQHVLGDLLGDGGGADRAAARPYWRKIGDRGAQDRQRVDAAMGEEILVLGGDEGVLDDVRDGVEGHEDAPLGREFREQAGIAGIDAAHHRRLVVVQPIDVRQVGAEFFIGADGDHAAARRRRSRSGRTTRRTGGRQARNGRRGLRFGCVGDACGRGDRRVAAARSGSPAVNGFVMSVNYTNSGMSR